MTLLTYAFTLLLGLVFGFLLGAFMIVIRHERDWKIRFTEHRDIWIDNELDIHISKYTKIGRLRNESGKVSQDYEYKIDLN